jgi:hypothetical protein
MKNILTFENFINESSDFNGFDKDDNDLIYELNYMYNLFGSGRDNRKTRTYESNLLSIYEYFMESNEEFSQSILDNLLFEADEEKELKKDMQARDELEMGDKSLPMKVARLITWIPPFTPVRIGYELLKIVDKKEKIKKLLKNVPEGPKKEKLRAELNNLKHSQVNAVAQLKKARVTKEVGIRYSKPDQVVRQEVKQVKDSYNYENDEDILENIYFEGLSKIVNILEAKGKISAEQKEKIMKQAESKGKAEGKSLASKAQSIAKKISQNPDKKAEALDSLKQKAESEKEAWKKLKQKAEEKGITLG